MPHFHRNDTAGRVMTAIRRRQTFASLKDDLAALRAAAPTGLVDTSRTKIGQSERGKDIHLLRLGNRSARKVLIAGCHHAREWISVEVPYLFGKYLLDNYASDSKIKRLVDHRDIWIVPMLNPDGHEHTVLNNRGWRKTRPSGSREAVDPNRNYATSQWNITVGRFSTAAGDDDYKGPSAAYAKEVRNVQQLVRAQRFRNSLDYHAFGRFVLHPWAGKLGRPPRFQQAMAQMLERVIDSKGNDYERFEAKGFYPELFRRRGRPPLTAQEGRIPGSMMDYVVEQIPQAVAITVELEPAFNDPRAFQLPQREIQPTFDLHRASMLAFVNCAGNIQKPPTRQALTLQEGIDQRPVVFQRDCSKPFESY